MYTMSCRFAAVLCLVLAFSLMIVPPLGLAHDLLHPNVLKFGVFPYKSPKTVVEMYGPLAAHLEKNLGKKIWNGKK